MKPLGSDYILYGVGYSVSGEPFSHYDSSSRQTIPLAASEDAFQKDVQQALEAVKESTASLARLEAEFATCSQRSVPAASYSLERSYKSA
jgi:hypothetical protein